MNIRQRILASGAIGIVAVVLLGGVGFWGQLRLGKALTENELSVNALRNHMEGDMMHDALRADVLAAFVVQPATARRPSRSARTCRSTVSGFAR